MRNLAVALIVASMGLSACSDAQKSTEVGVNYVPSSKYQGLNCSQLREEDRRLRASIEDLTTKVDKSYKHDKNMEAVTWILFWPAVFAMDGNDAEATRLATAKGEADALHTAMQNKKCRM